MLITVAGWLLAVAVGWRAGLVLFDDRRVRRTTADGVVYHPTKGWRDEEHRRPRRQWAWVALVVSGVLLVTAGSSAAIPACAVAVWAVCHGRLLRARYTPECLAALAGSLLVQHLGESSGTALGAAVASFFAAQMYFVAGLRKLASAQFLSGRVLLDNLAYRVFVLAGSGLPFRHVVVRRFADVLVRRWFLRGCQISAVLVAVVELVLGVGVLGLLPSTATLALAIATHGAFLLVDPLRVVPFSIGSIGLVVLSSVHPLLSGP